MSKRSGERGVYKGWDDNYEDEEDGASMSIVEIEQALLVWQEQEQEWAGRQTRLIQAKSE